MFLQFLIICTNVDLKKIKSIFWTLQVAIRK